MSDSSQVPGVNQIGGAGAKNLQAAQAQAAEQVLEAESMDAEESFFGGGDSSFNPMFMMKDSKKLEDQLKKNATKEAEEADDDDDVNLKLIDDVTKLARSLEKKNPEFNHRALLGLKADIKEDDDAETIYEKVRKFYKDEFLADEALDFLEQTTNPHTKHGQNVRKARALLNTRHEREVKAGRNINDTAQAFQKKGLASAGSLRDLYKEVTKNPKEPTTLFEELNESYSFVKMKQVLSFLLHSLGKDMKSKGPSITVAELTRLFAETRTMQAILSIYKFFYGRMNLIKESLERENLKCPKNLTFELLAKLFGRYIQERYPSPDKVLRLATQLGLDEEIIAQIIVFTQYRDALRGVSPKLFRSLKHRQELLMALIETISELDDILEDEENDEDDEEQEEDKKGWSSKDTVE
jgi:type III secretion protein W